MLVVYGVRKKLKFDRSLGYAVCPNCKKHIEASLAHEYIYAHIFFIPFLYIPSAKIKFCPNCGVIETISSKEFKRIKKQIPKLKK